MAIARYKLERTVMRSRLELLGTSQFKLAWTLFAIVVVTLSSSSMVPKAIATEKIKLKILGASGVGSLDDQSEANQMDEDSLDILLSEEIILVGKGCIDSEWKKGYSNWCIDVQDLGGILDFEKALVVSAPLLSKVNVEVLGIFRKDLSIAMQPLEGSKLMHPVFPVAVGDADSKRLEAWLLPGLYMVGFKYLDVFIPYGELNVIPGTESHVSVDFDLIPRIGELTLSAKKDLKSNVKIAGFFGRSKKLRFTKGGNICFDSYSGEELTVSLHGLSTGMTVRENELGKIVYLDLLRFTSESKLVVSDLSLVAKDVVRRISHTEWPWLKEKLTFRIPGKEYSASVESKWTYGPLSTVLKNHFSSTYTLRGKVSEHGETRVMFPPLYRAQIIFPEGWKRTSAFSFTKWPFGSDRSWTERGWFLFDNGRLRGRGRYLVRSEGLLQTVVLSPEENKVDLSGIKASRVTLLDTNGAPLPNQTISFCSPTITDDEGSLKLLVDCHLPISWKAEISGAFAKGVLIRKGNEDLVLKAKKAGVVVFREDIYNPKTVYLVGQNGLVVLDYFDNVLIAKVPLGRQQVYVFEKDRIGTARFEVVLDEPVVVSVDFEPSGNLKIRDTNDLHAPLVLTIHLEGGGVMAEVVTEIDKTIQLPMGVHKILLRMGNKTVDALVEVSKNSELRVGALFKKKQ